MDVKDYLVTLCLRRAELSGLKELPGGAKDQLTPLVLLAPWLATTPLSRAIEKFEEAYPARPYFIDVDTYYQPSDKWNDAKDEWTRLAQSPSDLELWHSLISSYPNACPCIQMAGSSLESALSQIEWARAHNRSFCLRMNMVDGIGAGIPAWLPDLVAVLIDEGSVDYAVVFDYGFVQNAIDIAPKAIGYIKEYFNDVPPVIPVVVSCTSFPNDFTPFDGVDEKGFTNRDLVAQIRQATNHPRVIYGDWGSTRPRSNGFGSTPKNRIDYPTDTGWIFARNNDVSISFQEAAQRIIDSDYWTGDLGIWGEQLIAGAAAGQSFAIDTMPKMYSARINIHLHRQAFYGHLPPPDALDEAWSDDL